MAKPTAINLNDTTPAALAGLRNVKWQAGAPRDLAGQQTRDVSACVDLSVLHGNKAAAPALPAGQVYFCDDTNEVLVGTNGTLAANKLVKAADANVIFSDVTTGNVSTAAHGFAPKLPNDATKYLDGSGAWSVPAGGGGAGGGSMPMYFTPFTIPHAADFVLYNNVHSAVTLTDTAAGLTMEKLADSAPQATGLEQAPGVSTFAYDYSLITLCPMIGGMVFPTIYFRDSATGKVLYLGPNISGQQMYIQAVRNTNWTTWSSTPYSITTEPLRSHVWTWPVIYVRAVFDGTNFILLISPNGLHWVQLYAEAKTAWFGTVPDKVGIALSTTTSTNAKFLLQHWKKSA